MSSAKPADQTYPIFCTGASGQLGSELAAQIGAKALARSHSREDGFSRWDLSPIDPQVPIVLIHLAGHPIAGSAFSRWTRSQKQRIDNSRGPSTQQLAKDLQHHGVKIHHYIGASAIGYYGHQPNASLDENCPAGQLFLSEVCSRWEQAHKEISPSATILRTGIVLSPDEGALAQQISLAKLGLLGTIGTGAQKMSWISQTDWVRAAAHLVQNPVAGPVNLVAPVAESQAQFARQTRAFVHAPFGAPLPATAAKLILGQMAEELLLADAWVLPKELQRIGFGFNHPTLKSYFQSLKQ